jgi:hypothetical protein
VETSTSGNHGKIFLSSQFSMPYISLTKHVIDLSLTYVVRAINVYSYVKNFYAKFTSGREIQGGKIKPSFSIFSKMNEDKQMKLVGIIV